MEKFIVSARKYRPQNFSTVIGQSHITTTLKNAINTNQLAHAFLFCGPRGVGKTTCARILAKTINCTNKTADGEACNVCNSCISFDNGTSLNIHELDAASNNSVDDIRSLVDQVRFAPQAGDYKVYIVDEVHMLSASAFNAFLKTLEEPPPYAIFILATTEKHKILPTILSRCQIFDFKRITSNDTVEHLKEICVKEDIVAENAALHVIAQKSEGCMRDSLSILDKIVSFTGGKITYANTLEHLNILDEDYFFKLLEFASTQNLSQALLLFDDINQKGFEGDTLLEGLTEFIRNLLVSKDEKAAILLEVAEDFKVKYIEKATEVSVNWMIAALHTINDAAINYKLARNKRLCVEMALIKLCYLSQAVEIIDGTEETAIKKKLVNNALPVAFRAIAPILIKPTAIELIVAPIAATLQIETPIIKEQQIAASVTTSHVVEEPTKKTGGFGNLTKMRARVLEQSQLQSETIAIDSEKLQKAWQLYITKLEAQKKNPAVTQFKLAVLSVVNNNSFTITTTGSIQQKFIEGERSGLISFLQQHFNNTSLSYNIEIVEDNNSTSDYVAPLSTKEQYLQLIQQYPLVQELKDKLKLELDY